MSTKRAAKKTRGVYENPAGSGIWWIVYYVEGKRHREKVGRRSDAITLYQKRKTDARLGVKMPETLRVTKARLFEELAADAMEYSKAHKRSHRGDVSNLNSLLPVFGKMKVEDITPARITEYLNSRTDLTPATINRYRSTLSMIFQEAMRNGKAKSNPARLVRLRKEDNARIRFLTFEEEALIRRIILERTPTHEPAFTFALETGMRLTEQHTLTWPQVHIQRRQVELLQTKNGSMRIVVLSEAAVTALNVCERRRNSQTNRVFLSRYGHPLDSPIAWFRQVMKVAVRENPALADISWHTMRHTFCSRLAMAGVDIRTIAALAGHKSLSMAMRYSHLSPDHNLSAIDRLTAYRAQMAGLSK